MLLALLNFFKPIFLKIKTFNLICNRLQKVYYIIITLIELIRHYFLITLTMTKSLSLFIKLIFAIRKQHFDILQKLPNIISVNILAFNMFIFMNKKWDMFDLLENVIAVHLDIILLLVLHLSERLKIILFE